MISEYYNEFENQFSYSNLARQVMNNFEDWLEQEDIPLDEAYYHIEDYCDNLPVSRKTQRNYRSRLRRFIEYIYDKQDINIIHEGDVLW